MPQLLHTVEDLVEEVRSQLDEENTDSIDTDRDILPALNRAQDYAFDILARKYPEPLLIPSTIIMQAGVSDYIMPENIFEDRVLKLEIMIPSGNGRFTYQELERISYRDSGQYESSVNSNIPSYYTIFGRTIRIIPAPAGNFNIRMWSMRAPEKYTLPQGRITIVPSTGNYVIVDSPGESLTTEGDQLGSYVNVVDGQTGEIKGSLQVQIVGTDKITFRSTPQRDTVLGRTISGSISDFTVEQDDYLAPIDGTCVPFFSRPISNFIIRYAINDLKGKLEELQDLEKQLISDLEQQVSRTWAGREQSLRVKRRSKIWGRPVRRWYWQ